jgi:ParB family chromosome partitioning protein
MQVADIPVEAITITALNCRKEDADRNLEELAADIARNGLLQPISVRALPGGQYEVIAGQRRLLAHRLANIPTIRAMLLDCTDEQAEIKSLSENPNRADMTYGDKVASFKRLSDRFNGDVQQIRGATGYSVATIKTYLAISSMAPEALRAAQHAREETGTLDVENIKRIAVNFRPEDHAGAFQRLAEGGFNTKANEAILKALPTDRDGYVSLAQLELKIDDAKAAAIHITLAGPFIRDPRNNRTYDVPSLTGEQFDEIQAFIERLLGADLPVAQCCHLCMDRRAAPGWTCAKCQKHACAACAANIRGKPCPFCEPSAWATN